MIIAARTAALSSLLFLTLSACEDGEGFPSLGKKAEDGQETTAASQAPQSVLKDVERPDIFNVTELALWDGRPSLGGVWVAHPDSKTPERVIVTNTKNGKSIPGALFRRERNNPGPKIQVSSDAAAALGLLAGQPAELKVLAVRQEEVVIEPEPLPVSDEEAISGEELAAAGVIAGSETDAKPKTDAKKPKRDNFFTRLFRKKPAQAATGAAAGAAVAGSEATATDASAPEVETTSLDPVTTGAAAAIARAEASDKPQPRPERSAASEAPSGLKNPYIQVGLFTVEANANAAAANLRQSGIVPTVRSSQASGNPAWRVLIGPVSTADDQAALLAQVKNLGYSDAYLTRQ